MFECLLFVFVLVVFDFEFLSYDGGALLFVMEESLAIVGCLVLHWVVAVDIFFFLFDSFLVCQGLAGLVLIMQRLINIRCFFVQVESVVG